MHSIHLFLLSSCIQTNILLPSPQINKNSLTILSYNKFKQFTTKQNILIQILFFNFFSETENFCKGNTFS